MPLKQYSRVKCCLIEEFKLILFGAVEFYFEFEGLESSEMCEMALPLALRSGDTIKQVSAREI